MEQAPGGRPTTSTRTIGPVSLTSRSRRIADASFGAILDASDRHRLCWNAPDGREIVGCGVAASVMGEGADPFRTVRERAETVFDGLSYEGEAVARPRAFGGFRFHGSATGPEDDTEPVAEVDDGKSTVWSGFDTARFVVPHVQVTRADDGTWLTVTGTGDSLDGQLDDWQSRLEATTSITPIGEPPAVVSRTRSTDRESWRTQVESALQAIATTSLEKVVLAQARSVELEEPIGLARTLERLRRRYPECFRFAIDGTDRSTFFGAPPERLVAKDGSRIETEALAGSVPRGETPDDDESHVSRLRNSDKLDAEHEFVVDAIRRQLAAVTDSVTVEPRTIKRLATIQHLQTPMTATLSGTEHVVDVVAALHPTPAVGGVPQETACETIRSIEPIDRGWYAAPIGWFDANGDGEFAVGIRSAVSTGPTVSVFAGNGIVAGSDADAEWTEIELKFRSILDEFQ